MPLLAVRIRVDRARELPGPVPVVQRAARDLIAGGEFVG
jgi:hypothetical protein